MANDNNKETKVPTSGNIYMDAAIEALHQARKEDKEITYLLITSKGDKCGNIGEGKCAELISAIASNILEDEAFAFLIKKAIIMSELHKNPQKIMDHFLEALDKSIDKAKENPSDAFKGFMDRIKNKKE
jgi:hypothetical protein